MRPSQGFWGTGEQGLLFQGNTGTKANFEGNRGTKTILGNREHRKQIFDFWGTGEQANLFQGNKGTGTPLGGPPKCDSSITYADLQILFLRYTFR